MELPTETKAHLEREGGAGRLCTHSLSLMMSQNKEGFAPVSFHWEAFSVILEIFFKSHRGKWGKGKGPEVTEQATPGAG